MSMRPLTLLVTITSAVFLSVLAQGQLASPDQPRKNLFAFTIGAEFLPSTSILPPVNGAASAFTESSSYALNLDYGRHIKELGRAELWLDVPALVGPSHRTGHSDSLLPTSLATFYVTPSARFVFLPGRNWNPWLSAGGGYGLYETSNLLASGAANPTIHTHTGVLQFGAGVDVKLPLRFFVPLGVRTEIRDFYSLATPVVPVPLSSDTQHGITASGGLIARF